MEHKFYYNSVVFYRDIQKIIPELNLNKSLRLLDQSFFLGEVYQPTILIDIALARMNEIIGEEVFCTKRSVVFNEQYTIFLPKGKEYFEALLNKEAATTVEEAPVEIAKEEESTSVEEAAVVSPDWEWINSLANNKDDKELLDVYALKEFNISLNKSKTLANMIKSFKKEL